MIHPRNPKEKNYKLFLITGTGSVRCKDGLLHDVEVVAHFTMWEWAFMIHRDVLSPELFTVSEASTGLNLNGDNYYTIDDALYFSLPFIERKRYHFATITNRACVKYKCNLRNRNTTGLTTLMQWKL